ncbi:MAG: hypothetical protein Q8L34_03525 [Candidatus Woesearchaeota archaeon]|nr:hypothetical protein [Candidatus Woesearchaeota archaeon]
MSQQKRVRKIKRACVVCGKPLTITLYEDGHHRNGYYFSTMKIPVGKGDYKKIGTSKVLGNKVDVVKWTGKEKQIEYWECNDCFDQASHETWLEELLEKLYGKTCKDYEKGCGCCQAWDVYKTIIDHNRGKL